MGLENNEQIPHQTGDSLDHFIAMMYINENEYTKENIISYIELLRDLEGFEYLKELKEDLEIEFTQNFKKSYELNKHQFEFIKKTIRNY